MANTPRITAATANTMLDSGIGTQADSGKLRIYDGTQPTNGGDAITTQVLLAELTMPADAFPSASSNTLTANAITQDSSADNNGTATWFRLVKADGTTILLDGSVGTSGADCNLNSVSITSGGAVSVTAMTITMPRS
jgi:hypothetical protein